MHDTRHGSLKDGIDLVSKDPEEVKRSLPQGNGVSGAAVPRGDPAVGALPWALTVPTRSTAQAAQTKVIDTRVKKKGIKVVKTAGGGPSKNPMEDELFVQMNADFQARDRDGDGVISPAEFRRVGVQYSLSKARIDKILREADADQDGVLSFSEYLGAASSVAGSA
jgi:hypothetical protein